MKAFLLFAITACAVMNFACAQWTQQTSPTTNNLYAVAFNNERSGYAAGAKGIVLRTNDGGVTWTILPSPDSSDIKSITIVDSTTVIVATANSNGKSAVYKSTTRGNSWYKVLSDDLPFYIGQIPNGNLFSTSTCAFISSNKGDTWLAKQPLNSTSIYSEIDFADNDHAFIGGNVIGDTTYYREFLRSENGRRWYPSYPFAFPNNFAFSSMSAISADTLFMFTNYHKRFHPKDSSQLLMLFNFRLQYVVTDTIWKFRAKIIYESLPDIINTCKFFSDTLAYAAGKHGDIYISRTAGKRWKKEYRGKITINNLCMITTKKGYAVGNNGLILKREVATINKVSSQILPLKIYPNPSTNSATLSFTLDKTSDIILQLVDESGVVVYIHQNKKYSAGSYQLLIPVANLQNGIYHMNFIVDGYIKTKTKLLVTH